MKEVISNKKKLDAYGTMSLPESCCVLIKKKLLEKLKDLESFTIPCKIEESCLTMPFMIWGQA